MALGDAATTTTGGAAPFASGFSRTASAGASGSSSASSNNSNAQFFMDDDEETLSLLTSLSGEGDDDGSSGTAAATADFAERLQGLAHRLLQDHGDFTSSRTSSRTEADPWTEWTATLESLGRQASAQQQQPGSNTNIALFGNFQQASVQKLRLNDPADNSSNRNSNNTLPAAFDTAQGKIHVRAVTSILQVSQLTAVQLTLSCLRSIARKEEEEGGQDNSNINSSSNSTKNLQSLLGTTVLMEKVTEYYYRQQTARLATLAECLRVEQDESLSSSSSSTTSSTIVAVLNAMDETYIIMTNSNNDNGNRGLFRLLLTAACRSHVNLQRQQLVPAGDLRQPASTSSATVAASRGGGSTITTNGTDQQQQSTSLFSAALKDDKMAWNQFVRHAMERKRQVTLDCWHQALEALLVLLYQRTTRIHASDFAMILSAFSYTSSSSSSSNNSGGGGGGAAFFSNVVASGSGSHGIQQQQHQQLAFGGLGGDAAAHKKRLGQVAGLICMECMSLWRAVDTTSSASPTNTMDDGGSALPATSWVRTHPLFANLLIPGSSTSSSAELQTVAQSELQVLSSLLLRFGDVVDATASSGNNRCPESLALLSFGLLLQLAAAAVVGKDHTTIDANASAPNVFWQNLGQAGMELSKLANGKCDALGYLHDTMLDLVTPPPLSNLDQEDQQQQQQDETELGASCMIYASIGRELLAALVMTYHETMLSARHASFAENLGIICNLIAVVYRNSSTLCQQFWTDWDLYSSPEVPHRTGAGAPLCLVLEMAHGLAAKWLSNGRQAKDEKILQAVSPLLKMVSSLVYNANAVEQVVVAFLPENLIRKAMTVCSSDGLMADPALYAQHRDSVMESIARLAELGTSDSCREAFRQSLQAGGEQSGSSGPFLLFRIASAGRGPALAMSCRIISQLLQGAPTQWILRVCMALKSMQESESMWRSTSEQEALVNVIRGLVNHMSMVIFSSLVDDNTAISFLEVLGNGLMTAAQLLPSSLSAISCPSLDGGHGATLSYRTAAIVMECLSNTLNNLRPVTDLHESPKVRAAAVEFESGLLGALLGSHEICNAVFYYATCPVSFSLACSLDEALRDVEVLQAMEEAEANSGSASTRAMWMMHHSSPGDVDRRAFLQKALAERLSSIESLRLDFDGVQVRHWLNGETQDALLHASLHAFGLLTDHMYGSLEMMTRSHHALLAGVATLPPVLRRHRDLGAAWTASNVTYFQLMLSLLNMDSDVPEKLSVLPLNMLFSFVTQSQKIGAVDDRLYRLVFQSGAFHRVISKSMHYALELVKPSNKKSDQSKTEAALAGLRLVAACVKLNPSVAAKLLGSSSGETFVSTLVISFEEMASILDKSRSQVAVDPLLLVCTAKECLDILFTVWKYARYQASNGFRGSVDFGALVEKESNFLTTLALFVFGRAVRQVELRADDSISERRLKSSLLTCACLALEILGAELQWVLSTEDPNSISQTRIVKAIDSALERDPRLHLTGAYRHFGVVRSLPALVDQVGICADFVKGLERSSMSSPRQLALLFWNIDEADDFSSGQLAFDRWLSSLVREAETQRTTSQALTMLSATHNHLCGEIRRLNSWNDFLSLYSGPLRKRRELSGSGSSSIAIALVGEIVGTLEQNVLALENAKLESLDELSGAIIAITGSGAASMLHFAPNYDDADQKWNPNVRLNVLSSLATSNQKILALLGSKDMNCDVVQKLLACALAFARAPVESEVDGQDELELINLELATTAVKVLRMLESISKTADWAKGDRKAYTSCFATCLSLLSSMCACASVRVSFLSQLQGVLVESSAVKSLIYQVLNLTSSGPSSDTVMTVVRFFQSLVCAGGTRFLSLLIKDGAFGVLNVCSSPLIPESTGGDVGLRGYLPLSRGVTHYDTAIGKEDPTHELFTASILLLATSLRTASRSLHTGESTPRRIYFIASEYLSKHDKSILACLRQVSSVEATARLTVRVLREAAAILSVVSELCGRNAVDLFKRSHPHLYRDLLDEVRAVARALCCYLGASGASRELFKGLDAEDSAAASPLSFAGLSPVFDILANGVSNAKHEAIRFSLFASHYTSAVTSDEHKAQSDYPISWAPRARSASMENNPKSESSLEQSSRSAVTCAFAFQLEKEASSCLFHAANVMWKTHPSAASFVTYSPEESAKLDGLSLVKVGMVIAFRAINQSSQWLMMSQHDFDVNKPHSAGNDDDPLEFGEVLSIDTVNRCWQVRIVGSDSDEWCYVDERQLAGVEDITKRHSVLAYAPAPETSTELEAASSAAGGALGLSVGQLILGLRWCHETHMECGSQPSTCLLAEVLSVLLGVEISLHKESKSHQNLRSRQPEASHMLGAQFLDLYGEEPELGFQFGIDDAPPFALRREGRLKKILSKGAWDGIRQQLHGEMRQASMEIEAKRAASRSRTMDVDNGWFASAGNMGRTSNNSSLFRGLSI